jgi:hypothetical protein
MTNLSHHTDLLSELVTSLLVRGIQMGDSFELGRPDNGQSPKPSNYNTGCFKKKN